MMMFKIAEASPRTIRLTIGTHGTVYISLAEAEQLLESLPKELAKARAEQPGKAKR